MAPRPGSGGARRGGRLRAGGSAALTLDPARRAERALAAARVKYQAGAFDAALALQATAEAGPLDQFERAQADLLRGQITFAHARTHPPET